MDRESTLANKEQDPWKAAKKKNAGETKHGSKDKNKPTDNRYEH